DRARRPPVRARRPPTSAGRATAGTACPPPRPFALPSAVASPALVAPVFEGVGVPVVTLFRDDGGVDARATAEHAARLVDLGMRAVVVAGSTGEAASLDRAERVELLRAVRKEVTAVPVIAGTGQPSTSQAVMHTKEA